MLTFFDAHMECSMGWLQPILSRIAYDRSVVVVPNIDTISSDDMSYNGGSEIKITSLRWHLLFNWYSYAYFIENSRKINFIVRITCMS